MSIVSRAFQSSIGLKLWMALSGLAMVGFLVAHLSGNLLVFAGPEVLNKYARLLRDYLPVLWVLRLGLVGAVVLHVFCAVSLVSRNKKARTNAYRARTWERTSMASRSMMLTGLVVLSFIIFHLAHLTFRWTHAEFTHLGAYDVYEMLIISFQSPLLCLFYVISVVLLMAHLSHGIKSFFQTIGFRHRQFQPIIDSCGPLLALVLSVGFLSIPIAIYFGLIS